MKSTLVVFLMPTILFLSSCYKEKTTVVTVRVQDNSGNMLAGAQVRLYAEPTISSTGELIADYTKISNNSGEAYFNLTNLYEPGQQGVGIFKVRGQYQNLIGENNVEVFQEENNTLVLTLE